MGRPTPLIGSTRARRLNDLPEGRAIHLVDAEDRSGVTGALLWIHGGGRLFGSPRSEYEKGSFLAVKAGVLVALPQYRTAPEDPFPCAVDDCMAALRWLRANAAALGVDPERIAVGGDSAGGGLAAEVAQRAQDEGIPVSLQMLLYPMLDDRTRASRGGRGRLIWTAASNRFAWAQYLQDAQTLEGSAARREDLRGLAPAWIGVGDLDLFYDEVHLYGARLRRAGVPCEVHTVPGMYHAADVMVRPQPPTMTALWETMARTLREAVGHEGEVTRPS